MMRFIYTAGWRLPVKYQGVIDRISSGEFTRAELRGLRDNAAAKLKAGDGDAQAVLLALDSAVAKDVYIIFMGFCPNAELVNRLDTKWREQGLCTFDFDDSDGQMQQFAQICPGDLIVLKKRQVFGKTMRLYGHGRVKSTRTGGDGRRQLVMEWASQMDVIEVPLMAANSTVNLRSMEEVERQMPELFFEWLRA
jgi:hypothetical protein